MANEIEKLQSVVEEIVVTIPKLKDLSRNNQELVGVLKELKDQEAQTAKSISSIAESAELIGSKLEAVEENEEAMQALFERIRDVKNAFAKKNSANTVLVGFVAVVAFAVGTYADYANFKQTGFMGLLKPAHQQQVVQQGVAPEKYAEALAQIKKIENEKFPFFWKNWDGKDSDIHRVHIELPEEWSVTYEDKNMIWVGKKAN